MPTLTRIRLNVRHSLARADLADAVGMHKSLMRLLPEYAPTRPRAEGGLLFRLERGPEPVLLVQTAQPPDLDALPPGYGTTECRDLAPMLNALTCGLPVRYRITAAATAARIHGVAPHPDTGRRRGRQVPLTGPDAMDWWQRRATAAGLEVTTASMIPRRFATAERAQPGPRFALAQFDGTARIAAPAQLAHALRNGIGKGKSYGAGLLTLLPA